jgi:hypothetical protein
MPGRDFAFVKVAQNGAIRSAFAITCRKCEAEDHFIQTGNQRKPPIAAEQYFRNRGWTLGPGPRADICRSCASIKPKKEKQDMEGKKVLGSLNSLKFSPPFPVAAKPASAVEIAEQPAAIGREDRRIIFAKLNEVYLDAEKGYDAGWTDHRVSEDLGVPRAWVESIRDENFGPARDNEEIRLFLLKATAIEEDIACFGAMISKAQGDIEHMKARVDDLLRLAKSVRKQVAA